MSKVKEEALQKYKEECYKQTKPYQYEMAYTNYEGEGPTGNSPDSVSATIIKFPDDTVNILNFEGITSEYLIFMCKEGVAEKNITNRLLSNNKGADVIYCDEDFMTDVEADLDRMDIRMNVLRTPWRKPDYSPDTLLSLPYFGMCFAIRTSFARNVPVLKKSPEISDKIRVWDFLLRATERTSKVIHVPHILYHRDVKRLLGEESDKEKIYDSDIYEALYDEYNKPGYQLCREAALRRRGISELPVIENQDGKDVSNIPLVSIIIPSKDNSDMLKECIRNIRVNAGKIKYEIIIVDNGSAEEEKKAIEHMIDTFPEGMQVKYIYEPSEFNYSAMCNKGAMASKAPFLLFLNDDVYAVCDGFLEKLVSYAQMPYIGAVGAKLLYPKGNLIQHVGVVDINKGPTHKLMTKSDDEVLYFGRNRYVWNVLAVTGACLMVGREKYFKVGGLSDKMKVGYNDVDLCVKLYENGYFNVVNNTIALIHHESVSRGLDVTKDKNERLKRERQLFYKNHKWLLDGYDPFYSPYLDRDTIDYKPIAVPEYQMTDYRNKVKSLDKLPTRPGDKVRFSIDNCYNEWAINEGVEDAYVFDGWGLIDKQDNVDYKRYMIFIPLNDDGSEGKGCVIANVSTKYRADIKQVFNEALNVYLSGFECRIPVSKLTAKYYRVGVLIKTQKALSKYKLSLGDIYEPGRGIITDNEILSGSVREGEGEE